MSKHDTAEQDPPIYAESLATFAADRTEWSTSKPPQFPVALTSQEDWDQWFSEDDEAR